MTLSKMTSQGISAVCTQTCTCIHHLSPHGNAYISPILYSIHSKILLRWILPKLQAKFYMVEKHNILNNGCTKI
jgi:hypothetical protein